MAPLVGMRSTSGRVSGPARSLRGDGSRASSPTALQATVVVVVGRARRPQGPLRCWLHLVPKAGRREREPAQRFEVRRQLELLLLVPARPSRSAGEKDAGALEV